MLPLLTLHSSLSLYPSRSFFPSSPSSISHSPAPLLTHLVSHSPCQSPSPPVFLFSPHMLSPLPHLTFTPSLSNSPKSDTCKKCNTYKVQTDAEEDEATVTQLKGEWELYLCKAQRAYQKLKEDTALSKCDPNVMLVTFDLQQLLPTPVLTTNVILNDNCGCIIWVCMTVGQARGTCM